MNEKQIWLKGAEVNYAFEGTGLPLMFIHGFCEDQTVWSEFIEPFMNTWKIMLVDLPGFGESSMPGGNTSMDFYGDCVKAILEQEKIRECVMIGHSMGGYITLNFASRFSEYLNGIGLFHSTALPDDEGKKSDRQRVAEFVRKNS